MNGVPRCDNGKYAHDIAIVKVDEAMCPWRLRERDDGRPYRVRFGDLQKKDFVLITSLFLSSKQRLLILIANAAKRYTTLCGN